MLGLDMLDVAIGIIFIYLLASLLCSAIVESLEAVLRRRATDLEAGILELVRDPKLVEKIYNHPLITGLYEGTYQPKSKRLPSYIPSRSFALAIMDLLISPDQTRHAGVAGTVAGAASVQIDTTPIVNAMAADPLVDQARHAVVLMITAAAGDARKARENIEFWFNSGMDRVSGWYKRRSQRALFLVGLAVAVTMNVDTIRILRELTSNKAKREAVVGIATNYAKQNPQPAPKSMEDQFFTTTRELQMIGLPIGWPSCPSCDKVQLKFFDRCWQGCWGSNIRGALSGLTLAGWLLTAFAVCLGAPFWFDLLNRFMVVRSTVKPQEKSGTEAPKEPQAKT